MMGGNIYNVDEDQGYLEIGWWLYRIKVQEYVKPTSPKKYYYI
jgi:hypothetical protein